MRSTKGFTLIEMSVALFIGAILAFAIIEIFFSARSVYGLQAERAREQENLRFASFFPVYIARLSGYRVPPQNEVLDVFSGGVVRGYDADGNSNSVTLADHQFSSTINNVLATSDVIAFSYQSRDTLVTNCHGTVVQANEYAMDIFYVDDQGQLKCRSKRSEDGGVKTNTQPLVTGIVGFQVLYGEDVTGDKSVNRYVPLTTDNDFNQVVAVRLQLCAVDAIVNVEQQAEECGTPADNPNNWLVQTVALRNVVP